MMSNMSEPVFKSQCADERNDRHLMAMASQVHRIKQLVPVDQTQRRTDHFLSLLDEISPFVGDRDPWCTVDKSFSFSRKKLPWNDAAQCAPHERATMTRPNQLFAGNGIQEFEKTT